MLTSIVVFLLGLPVADADADALRSTAPSYLVTLESAREHLLAARIAAMATGTVAEDLLAIGHHESRHRFYEKTSEGPGMYYADDGAAPGVWVRHRWSCGVMTPNPKPSCAPEDFTPLGGYLAGARHLAVWYRNCRGNRICALNGYAGGKNDYRTGLPAWQVFDGRARMIRRAIGKANRTRALVSI